MVERIWYDFCAHSIPRSEEDLVTNTTKKIKGVMWLECDAMDQFLLSATSSTTTSDTSTYENALSQAAIENEKRISCLGPIFSLLSAKNSTMGNP